VALPDGAVLALATGVSDRETGRPMAPSDRMLQGSVGKTYVAAVALQLVGEGRLGLDDRVAAWLGAEPWFGRLPNAADLTVRALMNHTSGLVRYEFDERFLADLTADPGRTWRPEEQLAYVLDTAPPFAVGAGWEYSDTNYLVLGLVLERAGGAPYVELLRTRLLAPLGLADTVPVEGPRVPGVVQGYAGPGNPFGGTDAMLRDGAFVVNPQFEWTGGGVASTAADLARWARLLYEGRAFDASLLPAMLEGVPARLGPGARYGLGVILRETPLGPSYGHSGFFPGYLTEVAYFPEHRVAVALQVNTSEGAARGAPLGRLLLELARVAAGE
jgi:D-alanyl-D-alanine carboxypeptidase